MSDTSNTNTKKAINYIPGKESNNDIVPQWTKYTLSERDDLAQRHRDRGYFLKKDLQK
jgi:hypothetical protein